MTTLTATTIPVILNLCLSAEDWRPVLRDLEAEEAEQEATGIKETLLVLAGYWTTGGE